MAVKNRGKMERDLLEELNDIAHAIDSDKDLLLGVGGTIIKEMKGMISRGISPIEGAGRFPEYKAPSRVRNLNRFAAIERKTAKAITPYSNYSRRLRKQSENKAADLKKTANSLKSRGYPFSVQSRFPSKRPRPVNLFLAGDFLESLRATVFGSKKLKLEIGFDNELSYLKEIGHREGVGGQPKRPIIPNDSESFSQRIQLAVERFFGQMVARSLKRRGR